MRLHTRDFQLCYNGLKNAYSGCLFIIRKDIPYQVLFDDPQGRFLIVHILLREIPYICINVYAPNSPTERAKTWENILQAIRSCEQLHLWENARIIMCGDFNMVETESDYTTVPSLISSREEWLWNEILDSLKCKDLWGYIGGHTIRYTYHSRSHRKAMSRLDKCYYSHISTLSHTSKMWIDATMLLSDHSPLLMLLIDSDWIANIPGKFHRIPLRVNHAWMQTTMFKSKVDNLIQQVLALKLSASLKWEAMVVGMHNVIRDCGKYFSKVLKAAKDEAKHVILSLTERVDMGHFLSHKDYSRLCDAYSCLQFVENKAIESAKIRARCMDVNDLHASSRCFFDFLRAKRAANTISSLHFGDKELRDGDSIADACLSHLGNLFAASYSTDDSWFTALHQALVFTPECLDARMAAACETSITEEEIFLALGSLKNGKAPGLDGLTKEFILTFWSSLKELLLDVCNEIWRDQKMPYSFKQGIIKLIPKVEMPKLIGDWRPISMMNFIYKIFAKIFALRLKPFIHKIVHPSQIGFIHKRSIYDSILFTQILMEHASISGQEVVGMQIDFEKAFDRVR
ncbi:hypothetical protein KP509_19G046500 [Ceratopteris richardii]|uniref:Reverse transcriptase domain-containing protein n=1 Tax=Ceratopteris richardii TaxID=49495 RepID=A0A8T2SNM0_CERRI|nr:hypothetical protein KP509_19G046500 [Ceratopteris richardii]